MGFSALFSKISDPWLKGLNFGLEFFEALEKFEKFSRSFEISKFRGL